MGFLTLWPFHVSKIKKSFKRICSCGCWKCFSQLWVSMKRKLLHSLEAGAVWCLWGPQEQCKAFGWNSSFGTTLFLHADGVFPGVCRCQFRQIPQGWGWSAHLADCCRGACRLCLPWHREEEMDGESCSGGTHQWCMPLPGGIESCSHTSVVFPGASHQGVQSPVKTLGTQVLEVRSCFLSEPRGSQLLQDSERCKGGFKVFLNIGFFKKKVKHHSPSLGCCSFSLQGFTIIHKGLSGCNFFAPSAFTWCFLC